MIVKDEAERLPRMLASLGRAAPGVPESDVARDFAVREVVIYDTGSSDDTVAICRDAGCRVVVGTWEGFAAARQSVFRLAQAPWIFWLDADEVLTGELRAALEEAFGGGGGAGTRADADAGSGAGVGVGSVVDPIPVSVGGFEVNRMVFLDGRWVRHGDWFPDWNLRLFRRDGWTMDDRLVHESVRVSGEVRRLDGLLEHHSFRDWDDLARRSARYAALWAKQERRKGRRTGPGIPTVRAAARFLRGFVFRGGFLDGRLGAKVAWANAREVRLKHALLRGPGDAAS